MRLISFLKCYFKLILLFAALLFVYHIHAQEYSYTQYNIKEGLAGSTVYCSVQDKDGFMWFGTETGLSRFDGSHFKNFTTADGLTDNEILKMFCDSKGRLWLSLFKKDICYYYKGKIYNKYNDSVLKRLHLTDVAWQVCEDIHGDILIMEQRKLHKIDVSGKVTEITSVRNRPFQLCIGISESLHGNFWVLDNDTLFEMKPDNTFSFVRTIYIKSAIIPHVKLSQNILVWREDYAHFKVATFMNNKEFTFSLEASPVSFDIINDSIISSNTINGTWIYNIMSRNFHPAVLQGKSMSSFYMDNENNYWGTTIGSGVFRINSLDFKNLFFFSNKNERMGIFSILSVGTKIFAGANDNYIYRWDISIPDKRKESLITGAEERNRIIALTTFKKNKIIVGTDVGITKLNEDLSSDQPPPDLKLSLKKNLESYLAYPFFISTVKGLFKIADDSLIVANRNSLLLFNPITFKTTDTLWRERTTTAFYYNDTIYSATLDGLLVLDKKKHAFFPGNKEPLLRNKITSIANTNDIIWIATYGVGVLGYYHGKVIMNITEKDGLTSNICRCINANGNILWVGTDKGLNKINLSHKPYHITKITSADALVSDIINTIYVDKGIVYVGTPEGVTYFNGKKIVSYSRCDLKVTQLTAGKDTLQTDANNFILTHKNNDISFEYSGISFKSAGEITYHYRLKGLDTSWQTTTQNFINYTTLPSGKYVFQLRAVNKFGVESNTVNIRFEVAERLWEKEWFKLLVAACIILLTWLIVRARIKYINKKNEEKMATMQRITELEQMALKSQMNPHFIFNSLNSIQQYVMDKDVEGANKFITAFSTLIRKTLEFSNKKRISVAEEMEYLSTYLALERERLSNKFIYNIRFKDQLNYNEVFIPPMILQPYVENSVRHGIRYRNDNNGVININVEQKNGSLFVIVEDNGIGRKEASKYKSKNIIQYQSKGMSLTASRIEMMNKKSETKMKVLIEDIEENNVAKGTKVTLIFPVDEGN